MSDHPAPNPNQDDALVEKIEAIIRDHWPEAGGQASYDAGRRLQRSAAHTVLAAVGPMIAAGALREAGSADDRPPTLGIHDRAWLIRRADQIEEGRA